MARTRHPPQPEQAGKLDGFARQVEAALEHFSAPEWLGSHSPLAAPYFLGPDFVNSNLSVEGRGRALQQLLQVSAETLDLELRRVLSFGYFKRDPNVDNVGVALSLNLSERTYYRLRIRAIEHLAEGLVQRHGLALRPETPLAQTTIGRATVLKQVSLALGAGESVYLSGPSGIGKTNLGTAILHQRSTEVRASTFWYTLRTNFNDQAASFLFALAYFLDGLGAGNLWRQLAVERGAPDLERSISLLRFDLHGLRSDVPLICVDELDVLQDEASEHVRILHILDLVRAQAPLLLLGQRVVLEVNHYFRLGGLDLSDVEHLLQQMRVSLAPTLIQQLHEYTRGNPALIRLAGASMRAGDEHEVVLRTLAHTPSMEALFGRIWRRLDSAARDLLMELSVFPNAAPSDAWHTQGKLIDALAERGLLEFNDQGGIWVVQHLRRLAEERAPFEKRVQFHTDAAKLREARAEYIGAMYHAIEGQQPAWAVWLWFSHRHQGIRWGQGSQALELLKRISPAQLTDERDKTALRLARAELLELAGEADEAEADLNGMANRGRTASRALGLRLEGGVNELQGQAEKAVNNYRESLDILAGLAPFQIVSTYSRMSFLHMYRLHDADAARREALLARAVADSFLGDLESASGRYDLALDHLIAAQKSAEENGHDLVILSRIYIYLGVVKIKLGYFDPAINYLNQAIDCYRKTGNKSGILHSTLNRSTAHTLAGRPAQGLADAKEGLTAAEQMKHGYLIAGHAACAAEACAALEDWDEAARYANYAMSQEEEFFRASALTVLGDVSLARGQAAEALGQFMAAIDNASAIGDKNTVANIWRHVARARQAAGEVDEARTALNTALQLFTEMNLPRDLAAVQAQLDALDAPAS